MTLEEKYHLESCLSSTYTVDGGKISTRGRFHWRNPEGFGLQESLMTPKARLPWSFDKVLEDFYIAYGNFESLEGCPASVGQNFYCYNNNLKNLIGGPKYVCKDYSCSYNSLESFEGAPDHIGGRFIYDDLTIEKWDFESKIKVLLEGTERHSKLISTIISPEEIQKIIDEDPISAAIRFKGFWNKLQKMEKYQSVKFPDELQKEADLLADLDAIGL